MQKQGIKVPPTWLINFSASPSGLRADPGLHEAQTGMQRSLSAMLEVLLCLVFASYSAKKVVLYLNDPVLSMVIFAYININIILSAI